MPSSCLVSCCILIALCPCTMQVATWTINCKVTPSCNCIVHTVQVVVLSPSIWFHQLVKPLSPEMHCTCCAAPARNAKQIAGMRAACRLAREILDKAHAVIKPGITTDYIDQVVSPHLPLCISNLNPIAHQCQAASMHIMQQVTSCVP